MFLMSCSFPWCMACRSILFPYGVVSLFYIAIFRHECLDFVVKIRIYSEIRYALNAYQTLLTRIFLQTFEHIFGIISLFVYHIYRTSKFGTSRSCHLHQVRELDRLPLVYVSMNGYVFDVAVQKGFFALLHERVLEM